MLLLSGDGLVGAVAKGNARLHALDRVSAAADPDGVGAGRLGRGSPGSVAGFVVLVVLLVRPVAERIRIGLTTAADVLENKKKRIGNSAEEKRTLPPLRC